MKTNFLPALLFSLSSFLLVLSGKAQVIPELVFRNPVLESGTDKQVGAKYRFANAADKIDAIIEIKKKSASNVVINNIDLTSFGWDKAFQPELGIIGTVPAWHNWWVEFEISFVKAGTKSKTMVDRFDVTSLDVDGDNHSISEYVQLAKPDSVTYSSLTQLTKGSADTDLECGECHKSSSLKTCSNCFGSGKNGSSMCGNCKGNGKLHEECGHAWDGSSNQLVLGPVLNFLNIDTLGTLVMSTSHYSKVDKFKIKIGGKSGAHSSTAGMRLNSLWFRSFNLSSMGTLPIKLNYFNARYNKPSVALTWSTGTEQSFTHFIIERSENGVDFKDAGIVFPNDNGALTNTYTYTDPITTSIRNVLYYRLKTVQAGKRSELSAIKVVKVGQQSNLDLQVYPNPVMNEVRVNIPENWQDKGATCLLYNSNGKLIKQVVSGKSNQTEIITMNDVVAGTYLVKVISGNESVSRQILKAK